MGDLNACDRVRGERENRGEIRAWRVRRWRLCAGEEESQGKKKMAGPSDSHPTVSRGGVRGGLWAVGWGSGGCVRAGERLSGVAVRWIEIQWAGAMGDVGERWPSD